MWNQEKYLVFLCAPKTGLIAQYWQSKQKINRIAEENILKLLYEIGTEKNTFDEPIPEETLLTRRHFKKRKFKQTLVKMQHKNWIICNQEAIFLTEKGFVEAKNVQHLHLLWEKYLSEKMHFQHDHVHNMAELIEHVITPELEKMIQNDLDAGQKK